MILRIKNLQNVGASGEILNLNLFTLSFSH